MLYPIKNLTGRAHMTRNCDNDYIAKECLEFYVRLVAALAIDLAFRPEYDELFVNPSQKNNRIAWKIATRFFIRQNGQTDSERRKLLTSLLDQYIPADSEDKTNIKRNLEGKLNDSLFSGHKMIGKYLDLGGRLIQFLDNVVKVSETALVDQNLVRQLQVELNELDNLRKALLNISNARNQSEHQFNAASVTDSIDNLHRAKNAFLENTNLVVIRDDHETDNPHNRKVIVMAEIFDLISVPEEQLLRMKSGDSLTEEQWKIALAENQIAFTPFQSVFLMQNVNGKNRFHLLSPLFAYCQRDVGFFLNVQNVFGDCSYLLLHTKEEVAENSITWERDGGMDVAPGIGANYHPTAVWRGVDWLAGREELFKDGTITTEIARRTGGGRYRINIRRDSPGTTYPDFLRCIPGEESKPTRPFAKIYSDEMLLPLKKMFIEEQGAPWKLCVWGTGGVGKTFTVLDMLKKHLEETSTERTRLNFDFVFFLTAKKRLICYDSEEDLVPSSEELPAYPLSYYHDTSSALQRLYCCISDGEKVSDSESTDYKLIQKIADKAKKRKLLLILDDVDSVKATGKADDMAEQTTLLAAMDTLHEEVSKNNGTMRLIITSRNPRQIDNLLELPILTEEQAVDFAKTYYEYYMSSDLRSDYVKTIFEKRQYRTPASIIRLVFLLKSHGSSYLTDDNLEEFEKQLINFSLATTNLNDISQYIIFTLCSDGMQKLPLPLVELILFDYDRRDIDESMKTLKEWYLVEKKEDGLIILQSEANFLLDAMEEISDSLPPKNRCVLSNIATYANGHSYEDSTVVDDIVCRLAEKCEESEGFSAADKSNMANRLKDLAVHKNDRTGAPDLRMAPDKLERVKACISRILETSSAKKTEAPLSSPAPAVEDPALAKVRELINQVQGLSMKPTTWMFTKSCLSDMLTAALDCNPFPEELFPGMVSSFNSCLFLALKDLIVSDIHDVECLFTLLRQCNECCKGDYSALIENISQSVFGL